MHGCIRLVGAFLSCAVLLAACGGVAPGQVRIEPAAATIGAATGTAVASLPLTDRAAAVRPLPPTAAVAATAPQRPAATPSPMRSRIVPPRGATPASVAPPSGGRADPVLRGVIERALGADAEHASVVVRRLTDGASARWNADRVYYAASLYKLEVLYEAFHQRQMGVLDFGRRYPLGVRYAGEDLGTLGRLPLDADGEIAVGEAVRAMITLSDNASAALLLDVLGHRSIDATMAALGLTSSSVNSTELPTTAADMARVMEAVARGEGLDARAAQEMTTLLLAQEIRSGIPRGVPAGVAVGNKTGTWQGATHDVAVVLAPTGAYVIAVLTDGSWNWEPITRVSRAVFSYFSAPPRAAVGR